MVIAIGLLQGGAGLLLVSILAGLFISLVAGISGAMDQHAGRSTLSTISFFGSLMVPIRCIGSIGFGLMVAGGLIWLFIRIFSL